MAATIQLCFYVPMPDALLPSLLLAATRHRKTNDIKKSHINNI